MNEAFRSRAPTSFQTACWIDKTVGLEQLRRAIASAPTSADNEAICLYLECEVIAGLENSLRLLDVLTCEQPAVTHAQLTAGELARLLDDTFGYLARRSDIELVGPKWLPNWRGKWVSSNPDALVFPDDNSFNLRTLLELLAYTRERQHLKVMGARRSDLARHLAETVPPRFNGRSPPGSVTLVETKRCFGRSSSWGCLVVLT